MIGSKKDIGKDRWDLLPYQEVKEVVKVLTFGSKKYSDNNWQKVTKAKERYFSALMRHLIAWYIGESKDTESDLSHLSHAACCILFLMWFDRKEK
jgi:hypothetical protein